MHAWSSMHNEGSHSPGLPGLSACAVPDSPSAKESPADPFTACKEAGVRECDIHAESIA